MGEVTTSAAWKPAPIDDCVAYVPTETSYKIVPALLVCPVCFSLVPQDKTEAHTEALHAE